MNDRRGRFVVAEVGHDPLVDLSNALFYTAVAALVVVVAVAVAWAFAVRDRRLRMATALRRLLGGALVTLVATAVISSSSRMVLATRIYDELPPPPDPAPPNTFGFRLADVEVDGRPVAVGAKIEMERRDDYVLSGRILGPLRKDHRFFVVSTNKSGSFVRTMQGEAKPQPDGSWHVEIDINEDFCYFRYPSLFSVVVATGAVATRLRESIQPKGDRDRLPLLGWFDVGHVYIHKVPEDPNLRTCFSAR